MLYGFVDWVHGAKVNTMCNLLSTECFMDAVNTHWQNQSMIDNSQNTAFTSRLEQVWTTCNYKSAAEFARALKFTQQVITNWNKRGSIGRGSKRLHEVTGVNTNWLETGIGNPFPDGPILAKRTMHGVSDANPGYDAAVSPQNEIDALRNVINTLASAIAETIPAVGVLASRALRNFQAQSQGTDREIYTEVLKVLDEAREHPVGVSQAARRRESP